MLLTYIKVFIVGGIICLIAQIMMDYFKMQTPYVMVTYVSLGAVLTFLGLYGYSLAKGVIKGIESDGFLGIFTGGITATAGGVAAAIFFGYIISVIFNPKAKP